MRHQNSQSPQVSDLKEAQEQKSSPDDRFKRLTPEEIEKLAATVPSFETWATERNRNQDFAALLDYVVGVELHIAYLEHVIKEKQRDEAAFLAELELRQKLQQDFAKHQDPHPLVSSTHQPEKSLSPAQQKQLDELREKLEKHIRELKDSIQNLRGQIATINQEIVALESEIEAMRKALYQREREVLLEVKGAIDRGEFKLVPAIVIAEEDKHEPWAAQLASLDVNKLGRDLWVAISEPSESKDDDLLHLESRKAKACDVYVAALEFHAPDMPHEKRQNMAKKDIDHFFVGGVIQMVAEDPSYQLAATRLMGGKQMLVQKKTELNDHTIALARQERALAQAEKTKKHMDEADLHGIHPAGLADLKRTMAATYGITTEDVAHPAPSSRQLK